MGAKMKRRILAAIVMSLVLAAFAAGTAGKIFAAPLSTWKEVDWSTVDREIDAVSNRQTNENIDISAGPSMEVPAETLRKLAGKNVMLSLHTGQGLAVSAFGRDLTTAERDLKITLTDEEDMIPENVSKRILADALYSKMFAMEEKVDYDIKLNIHFSLGKDYAGKYANLYHFDELADRMVYDDSFIITGSGMAMFSLSRGDEYILTVTDSLLAGAKVDYTVAAGDCLIKIAQKNGISLGELLAANPNIKDANKIYPGEIIAIVKQ